MTSSTKMRLRFVYAVGMFAAVIGCDNGGSHATFEDASAPSAGGSGGIAPSTGGASTVGGTTGTGGIAGSGGAPSAGGTTSAGGITRAGGRSGNGGRLGTGGAPNTGGTAGGAGATGNGGGPGSDGSTGPRDSGNPPETGPASEAGTDSGGTPGVLLQGRFDRSDATKPSFGWSGSAMIARFQGTGATLRIDGSPNQFTVVVDGSVLSQVLKVVSGTSQYSLAANLSSGVHDVAVWRRTEGNQGESRFLGIDVTGGQLQAPPAAPDRRIEIYGDSITAGYGLDGVGPSCPWSPDTENYYLTYGALTARELGADLHAIAWSGIGMYRNYGVSGASSDAMPFVYARTLPSQSASAWDFKTWQPHAVVINLGTNDASTSGDPGAPYETAYLQFVRTLRQKYPDTLFVLTIGPMLDGTSLTAIRKHIEAVKKTITDGGDSKISFLEFPVQVQEDGYGCDWHPSAKTHAKMAPLLVAELKARLGW